MGPVLITMPKFSKVWCKTFVQAWRRWMIIKQIASLWSTFIWSSDTRQRQSISPTSRSSITWFRHQFSRQISLRDLHKNWAKLQLLLKLCLTDSKENIFSRFSYFLKKHSSGWKRVLFHSREDAKLNILNLPLILDSGFWTDFERNLRLWNKTKSRLLTV